MGRWTRIAVRQLVAWIGARRDAAWLDVGSGTGIVAQAILDTAWPGSITGVDLTPALVEHARAAMPGLRFELGDATALPFGDAEFDAVVGGFILNFIPDTRAAVAEMARVARPGGTVATCVWEYGAGMELLRHFWEAAAALDPDAPVRDAQRAAPAGEAELRALFEGAGLRDVETRELPGVARFGSFDELWEPFTLAVGASGQYVQFIDDRARERLRSELERRVPIAADGSIELRLAASAVRGRR